MFTSNISALILEMIIMHNWQRGDQMCFCQAGTMVKAMRAVIFVTQLQFLRIPLLMKAMCHHSYQKMEKHIKRDKSSTCAFGAYWPQWVGLQKAKLGLLSQSLLNQQLQGQVLNGKQRQSN